MKLEFKYDRVDRLVQRKQKNPTISFFRESKVIIFLAINPPIHAGLQNQKTGFNER
jgi:hypothetical protein